MPSAHPADILVTVTGASGFIALHCIRELLTRGYRVRGTVRNLASEPALRKALLPLEPGDRLSFVAAELLSDVGWKEAVAGATYVLHVASPFPTAHPKDENELIRPAREGATRVLQAARDAGVKRVVMTSSIAAIIGGREGGRDVAPFDESVWSDLARPMGAYEKSKTLAEQAAWDLVRQPGARPLELVTINPSFVIGPSLSGAANTSNEIVRKLIDREVPGCPRLFFSMVDVRDVAIAHVLAMTAEKAAGERFIVSSDGAWLKEIAATLAGGGYKVPTRAIPNFLVRLLALFDPTVKLVVGSLDKPIRVSSDKAKHLLAWSGRSMGEIVLDTAASITSNKTARG